MIRRAAIDNRTVLPLANIIKPLLQPEDDVITYNQYYQELPFYLERRITILNWQNEMSQGMRHQDTSAWMINDSIFWQRYLGKGRVFVFISKDEFKKWQKTHPKTLFYLLGQTLNNVVLTNHPL